MNEACWSGRLGLHRYLVHQVNCTQKKKALVQLFCDLLQFSCRKKNNLHVICHQKSSIWCHNTTPLDVIMQCYLAMFILREKNKKCPCVARALFSIHHIHVLTAIIHREHWSHYRSNYTDDLSAEPSLPHHYMKATGG